MLLLLAAAFQLHRNRECLLLALDAQTEGYGRVSGSLRGDGHNLTDFEQVRLVFALEREDTAAPGLDEEESALHAPPRAHGHGRIRRTRVLRFQIYSQRNDVLLAQRNRLARFAAVKLERVVEGLIDGVLVPDDDHELFFDLEIFPVAAGDAGGGGGEVADAFLAAF